ncbi:MAG: hypothetical protein ACM35E_03745, partial [Deltaproteobacteria bacterium]
AVSGTDIIGETRDDSEQQNFCGSSKQSGMFSAHVISPRVMMMPFMNVMPNEASRVSMTPEMRSYGITSDDN